MILVLLSYSLFFCVSFFICLFLRKLTKPGLSKTVMLLLPPSQCCTHTLALFWVCLFFLSWNRNWYLLDTQFCSMRQCIYRFSVKVLVFSLLLYLIFLRLESLQCSPRQVNSLCYISRLVFYAMYSSVLL